MYKPKENKLQKLKNEQELKERNIEETNYYNSNVINELNNLGYDIPNYYEKRGIDL